MLSSGRCHAVQCPAFIRHEGTAALRYHDGACPLFSEDSFANEIYQNTLFLEFMIHLNRAALSGTLQYEDSFQANEKILSVLTYMNEHLTEDITVDSLAEHFLPAAII